MMGILPLQFASGDSAHSLGLSGRETFAIEGLEGGMAGTATAIATPAEGEPIRFPVRVRLDTPREREYLQHGGILRYVLRRLLAA
jgi:aconitate hydratase